MWFGFGCAAIITAALLVTLISGRDLSPPCAASFGILVCTHTSADQLRLGVTNSTATTTAVAISMCC